MVTARWVSESARPFHIVTDRCYKWLQKEGRPDRYIPSRETVSRDVKHLYNRTKEKLIQELQVSICSAFESVTYLRYQDQEGEIAIAIDCWTSPNHQAWMSITTSRTRQAQDGTSDLVTHLLDFIELPCSHSAVNMAEALAKVLEEYGIDRKVSFRLSSQSRH